MFVQIHDATMLSYCYLFDTKSHVYVTCVPCLMGNQWIIRSY